MDLARKHGKKKKLRKTYTASIVPGAQAAWLYLFLLIILALTLSSCGGGSSTTSAQGAPQVSGNWQFTLTTTGDSFVASPLEGGFILQKKGSLTGQIAFSIVLPSTNGGANTTCNSGTATVTGTVSGQSVTLTAVAGTLDANGNHTTQTLTLNGGTLSSNNSSIQNGTYSLTAGYANVNGQFVACGVAQDAGTWSATLVPPLTGGFQGFFHSTTGTSFANQDFPVS